MMNDQMNKVLRGNTLCSDGEDHRRLRRITANPLAPAMLNGLKSDITTKAEQIVDRLVAKGRFCAVTELATALPIDIGKRHWASPRRPLADDGLGRANVQLFWAAERSRAQRISCA
jgi:cytochrome P450